jgi:hypothetical protein
LAPSDVKVGASAVAFRITVEVVEVDLKDIGTNAELEVIPPAANVVTNKTLKLFTVILMFAYSYFYIVERFSQR